ncbi:MAG: dipeptide epimerase [Lachnospiraceae bacterium]|nr:dipeptide epimerase [Lachnospiraceae bacterium]
MKISDIQFEVRSFRFEEPMRVAFATITEMETCIVRVITDEGLTGYGEAAPFPYVTGDTLETVTAVGSDLKKSLIGLDPRAIGVIHRVMDSRYAGNTAIKAGIDIACYDIAAKAAGVPLYKYLGGDDPHVHSDVTIGIDTPEAMAMAALSWVRKRFEIIKVKLGEDIETDVARIRAIREAVGSGIAIRIDANQGWSVKDAVRISRPLAELGVGLMEQPVPAFDFEGLREVRKNTELLVAADESCHSVHDAAKLAAMRAVDVVNIKLMKCGGIYNALKISAICEGAGIACMIGCMGESTLANLAGMHLAAALDNITEVDLDSVYILKQEDVYGGYDHRGGRVTLWDVPGIGCSVKGE